MGHNIYQADLYTKANDNTIRSTRALNGTFINKLDRLQYM